MKNVIHRCALLWGICLGALLLGGVGCTSSSSQPASPEGAFITVWRGVKDSTLRIPIVGDYLVTWYEKGTPAERYTERVSLHPASASSTASPYLLTPQRDGEYVVEVQPEGVAYMCMRDWDYGAEGMHLSSAEALLRVEQFGKVRWLRMEKMFAGCKNMVFAEGIDTPDLSQVRSTKGMFYGCARFNSPLAHWDVSAVEDMSSMFEGCHAFNQPLGAWNVQRVYNMDAMFLECSSFNQPLDGWRVPEDTMMHNMFDGSPAEDQPIVTQWRREGKHHL